jgi:hypothetical protein
MHPNKEKPGSARAEAAGARRSVQSSSPPAASAQASSQPLRCEEALATVIARARALAEDTHATRQHLPSGRSRPGDEAASAPSDAHTDDARAQLTAALGELEPETALKIRQLMIAGRDGQSVAAVKLNVSLVDADSAFSIMAADSGENGPLLVEYLLKGHAIACASGIDLDRPLAEWRSRSADNLEERAWLSFGKQLASSASADWQCFAIMDPGTQGISKLYVKLGDRAWWSFQAQIDRPTLRGAEKERRALSRRRFKGVSSNDLEALVLKLNGVQGRALRRAARAICARVGQASPAKA